MSKKNGDSNVPFYQQDNAYKKCGIVGLIGGLLMIAGAFLYWMNLYTNTGEAQYDGMSLFTAAKRGIQGMFIVDMDGKVNGFHFSFLGLLTALLLLLYLAVVVFLIIIDIKDNFKRVPFLENRKKRIRIGLLLLTLILAILITRTPAYQNVYQQFVYLKESWQGFIDRAQDSGVSSANIMKCYLFVGPGMIAYIVGAVLYFISIAYNFVLETLNEDDEIERIVKQNKEQVDG
ncbi:MAG: hypothetical protein IJ749_01205 [Eubacterium sp.]|nr:hypothetical protein [Eubacterium sp.]